MRKYSVFLLLVLIIVLVFLLFWGNKTLQIESEKNDATSFFYKDTINVDSLFPQYEGWGFEIDNKDVGINNREFYLLNPDSFSVSDIRFNIIFSKGTSSVCKEVKYRCWQEDFSGLNEITKGKFWAGSKLHLLCKLISDHLFDNGKKGVVACGDSVYFFDNGNIVMEYLGAKQKLKSKIPLETYEYNQMIRGGNNIFFRNGPKIYMTSDNFQTFKLIYDDRRGIKESMVWDEGSERLLFTMYTPDTIRLRHYLLAYSPVLNKIDTLQTFFTTVEGHKNGKTLYCRHIHLLCKDPYTGYLFLGVGDFDDEPAIYMSRDGGQTLETVGKGTQCWRTLSFFFTDKYIYWTTDSDEPQYIYRVDRTELNKLPVNTNMLSRFPLINSALWCNVQVNDSTYYLGSNSEGCYYDDYHRIYRITFGGDGVPRIYAVFEEKSLSVKENGIRYHQTSPLFIDSGRKLWCYDTHIGIRCFKIIR